MSEYEGKRFRSNRAETPDGSSARHAASGHSLGGHARPQAGGERFAPRHHQQQGTHHAAGRPAGGGEAHDARPAGGADFSRAAHRAASPSSTEAFTRAAGASRATRPARGAQPGSGNARGSARGAGGTHAASGINASGARRGDGSQFGAVAPNPYQATSRGGHAGSHTHGAAPRGHAAAPSGHAEAPRPASPHAPSPYSRSAASRLAASRTRTAAGRGSRTSGAPRKRSGRDIVSKVLIGVGILLLLVAGGIFISAQIGYQKAGAAYDELSQYVTVDDSSGDGVPVVDWDALKQVSEDIVAWIYIPGTDISFPVVQGDTNDQYLRALPDGSWNESGSIMLDCDQQAPGMVGQQTTVYGHHMSNGSMFDPIEKTLDQANFDKMTTVYYLTPETTYKLSPLYTARVPETYVEARQENFGDQAALAAYLEDLRGYAQAEASNVDERIASTDRVLALVTCSGLAPADHRAIMICTVTEETPSVSADDVQADVGAEGANASSDELVNPDLQG